MMELYITEESIKILKELENLKNDDAPLILYCLLNRIPIVVFGKDTERINTLIGKLTTLIPFRNEKFFGSTFNTQDELSEYILEENLSYETRRHTYVCYCGSTPFAIKNIKNFKSWIIGLNNSLKIKKTIKEYLGINLKAKTITVELVGLNRYSFETELLFEKTLLKAFLEPEEIEKRNVYFKKFKNILLQMINGDLPDFLADIQEEEEAIKLHIYKMHLHNFVAAAEKVFLILSKIHLIDIKRNDKEVETPKLSKETILDVVNYADAPIHRILSFIQEEFFGYATLVSEKGEISFSKYIDESIISAKRDYIIRMGGF